MYLETTKKQVCMHPEHRSGACTEDGDIMSYTMACLGIPRTAAFFSGRHLGAIPNGLNTGNNFEITVTDTDQSPILAVGQSLITAANHIWWNNLARFATNRGISVAENQLSSPYFNTMASTVSTC